MALVGRKSGKGGEGGKRKILLRKTGVRSRLGELSVEKESLWGGGVV